MATTQRPIQGVFDPDSGRLTGAVVNGGAETFFAVVDTATGNFIAPDGGVMAISEVTPYVNVTATGTAFTGPCELAGYDCTSAGGNITIYDGTSTSGTVIVPTTALAVGRVEFLYKRALTVGCHVVLSGVATVNVLVG